MGQTMDQMKMLNQARKLQKELKNEIVEVEAGDGAVVIQITGELKIKKVSLDPEKIDFDDIPELERWIENAFRDGYAKAQEIASDKILFLSCSISPSPSFIGLLFSLSLRKLFHDGPFHAPVGHFGDAASVDHDEVGLFASGGPTDAFFGEHTRHCRRFRKIEFAAKRLVKRLSVAKNGIVNHEFGLGLFEPVMITPQNY